ncbi:hypothetical protein [Flavihumibacter petaseus]|uniref:Macroglobulin domain-containing protein n=1 Tax=Flavihumibacter petaseus NBRC 106054 TaxID=1220578 RepID=A0A0E9MZ31_9BACT|nr:hypothetical protein [Flavihumibacter petaseus]GAO42992.1 hypothetical protein FPE01S_02_00970 [Flavihumibacter petaseus NBRC 106054]
MKKYFAVILLVITGLSQTSAQVKPATLPEERIVLQTDKTVYLAGEMIWLKAACYTTGYDRFSPYSTVAYIELLDEQNRSRWQIKAALVNGVGEAAGLLSEDIPTGVYTLCGYTRWMENFGPVVFFRKSVLVINSFQKPDSIRFPPPAAATGHEADVINLELTSAHSALGLRENNAVQFNLPPGVTVSAAGLSASVHRLDSWETSSFLPAKVPAATVMPDTFPYPPELVGPLLTGKLTSRQTGRPLPDKDVILSIPGSKPWFGVVTSNARGQFTFEVPRYFGDGEVILQPFPKDSALVQISITSPFYPHTVISNETLSPKMPLTAGQHADMRQRHQEIQLWQGYAARELQEYQKILLKDTLPFFGPPDEAFLLDDYTRFTTMEEVFREYVLSVMVRRHRDGLHLLALDKRGALFFEDDPFLLLDGVPLFNNNRFFAYDPLKLKRGAVLAGPYLYGEHRWNGVVFLQTYRGDLDGFPLEDYLTVRNYNGMSRPRNFFSPQYAADSLKQSRLPDFREVLYWNPRLAATASGKAGFEFYTGDVPGNYQVVVEGISSKGELIQGKMTFSVK